MHIVRNAKKDRTHFPVRLASSRRYNTLISCIYIALLYLCHHWAHHTTRNFFHCYRHSYVLSNSDSGHVKPSAGMFCHKTRQVLS